MKILSRIFAIIVVFALVTLVAYIREIDGVSERESSKLLREHINEAIIACYSVDGVYPATLIDLENRSGHSLDSGSYIVMYEVYGSNMLPDVTVIGGAK